MADLNTAYTVSRSTQDEHGTPLQDYTAARLVRLIKDGDPLMQDAIVVLLHDYYDLDNLRDHFSAEEIARHFTQYLRR